VTRAQRTNPTLCSAAHPVRRGFISVAANQYLPHREVAAGGWLCGAPVTQRFADPKFISAAANQSSSHREVA